MSDQQHDETGRETNGEWKFSAPRDLLGAGMYAGREAGYIGCGIGIFVAWIATRAELGSLMTYVGVFFGGAVPIFGIWFARLMWIQRRLTARQVFRIDDDGLVYEATGGLAPDRRLSVSWDELEMVEKHPVSSSRLEGVLPLERQFEITVMTVDDLYTVAEGLDEEEIDEAIESVEAAWDARTGVATTR